MNNREIADAFMKGNYDGVRKLHEEELEQQANRFTTIFIILSVVLIGAFCVLYSGMKDHYKDDLETFKCKVEVRDKSLVDSLQNYCDTANCIHIIQK